MLATRRGRIGSRRPGDDTTRKLLESKKKARSGCPNTAAFRYLIAALHMGDKSFHLEKQKWPQQLSPETERSGDGKKRMLAPGLVFLGIIDRDVGNQPSPRIYVIGRYSFENYLLDPVNIFCTILITTGNNPVSDIDISSRDEHVIRTKSNDDLQKAVDYFCQEISTAEPGLVVSQKYEVEYTTGQIVEVPDWVIDHRGHDLLVAAQKAFGHSVIKPPNLIKSWRRTRLVPVELAKMLSAIQLV